MGTFFIKPDAFKADPYGWVTNQLGHIGLAAFTSFWLCFIWAMTFAELPDKILVWKISAAIYLALEWAQRGALWDTIQDCLFVLVYGLGIFLFSFDEFIMGDIGYVIFSMEKAWPFVGAATIHLMIGYGIRWWQRYQLTGEITL